MHTRMVDRLQQHKLPPKDASKQEKAQYINALQLLQSYASTSQAVTLTEVTKMFPTVCVSKFQNRDFAQFQHCLDDVWHFVYISRQTHWAVVSALQTPYANEEERSELLDIYKSLACEILELHFLFTIFTIFLHFSAYSSLWRRLLKRGRNR